MKNTLLGVAAVAATSWHYTTRAQILEYVDCEVRDPASFIAASEQFIGAMSDGARPVVSVDLNLWNGASKATHTVILGYDDYDALEAFFNRIEDRPDAYRQLMAAINSVATCGDEGLAVQLGAWGNLEAAWKYYAVYPMVVTDAARYVAAFQTFAAAAASDAPGPILFYLNKAGRQDVTHFVVFLSPSLASLNAFLDTLPMSDAYTQFLGEVAEIRTLGTAAQAQRLVTWAP